jgi:hypothetical protein
MLSPTLGVGRLGVIVELQLQLLTSFLLSEGPEDEPLAFAPQLSARIIRWLDVIVTRAAYFSTTANASFITRPDFTLLKTNLSSMSSIGSKMYAGCLSIREPLVALSHLNTFP